MDVSAATEPIRSNVAGSFPWTVLHDRHPALLQQVRDAHPYPPQQRLAIDDLEGEIAGVIGPLTDTAADAATWADWARPYLGRSWFDVPFLWAENYFYRKLLAAVGYLEPGPWQGIDPFAPLKNAELSGDIVEAELAALERLDELTAQQRFDALLLASLWGNRADLGFLIGSAERATAGAQVDRLVVDDRPQIHRILPGTAPATVVVVADNAGRELLPDLVLIDELLTAGLAAEVVLQIKPRPYFVSDATTADVLAAITRLGTGPSAARAIGQRLRAAIGSGALAIRADPFSVAPLGYQHAGGGLQADFAAATLTIMKGDLNYRRLVGDRNWPATSSFAELTGYFPGPVVALRTLKSDVVVGLDEPTLAALESTGTPWRTSGRYGLIQVG
jgi:damage control phosphatase ARMT1-like protein